MDRRTQPFRRQVNQAFCSPDGSVSLTKIIGVFAQIMFLYQSGIHFEKLILHSDAMLVVVLVLTAPELIKKYMTMKAGGSNGSSRLEPGKSQG